MARSPSRTQGNARNAIRCAIYTRKSTEEGLEQAFNSLDAQREACAAYILSQRHEGWVLLPDYYDDGGYSGGNMDRPGLKQLLAEVQAGRVDVIVVYKVDRLTRSLADFAKIVEVLDARGASFVSVTQAFNTTTSMGRLTLNVLLSFAQFEREVTGERIRDKIAASKKKGMWMGGPVPLGYEVSDRKLVVNEAEAETVRAIFERYLELGNVRELMEVLKEEGIRTKQQRSSRGGSPFGRGALYHLLTNRLYRGEVTHRDQVYPGEHQAIVPESLWDAVQTRLACNAIARKRQTNAREPSLLAGRITDGEGRRMVPSHASKGALRYRYYVSAEPDGGKPLRPQRIAAGDVEQSVIRCITTLLADHNHLIGTLGVEDGNAASAALSEAQALGQAITTSPTARQREVLDALDVQVSIGTDRQVTASYDASKLATRLGLHADEQNAGRAALPIDSSIMRRGHEMRLIVAQGAAAPVQRDGRLIALLIKAQAARKQLIDAEGSADASFSASHVARMARLAFLAPDIVAAILDGTQPPSLTARRLLRASELPLCWAEQRRMFGFG